MASEKSIGFYVVSDPEIAEAVGEIDLAVLYGFEAVDGDDVGCDLDQIRFLVFHDAHLLIDDLADTPAIPESNLEEAQEASKVMDSVQCIN